MRLIKLNARQLEVFLATSHIHNISVCERHHLLAEESLQLSKQDLEEGKA